MPRLGEVVPRPVDELCPYLNEGVEKAIAEVSIALNKFDPDPFGIVADVLTDEGITLLGDLRVPENGKCPVEDLMAHPVGGPLARTMGRISLANMDMRSKPSGVTSSLKNETGIDLTLPAHRDLLDGHAVLFNYMVIGDLWYVLDGERHELKSNELVVLNGAAVWGDITNFLPGEEDNDPNFGLRTLGGVTMVHSVEGRGFTSRNRLLVYADGCKTLVTQIPPLLPPWF